MTRHILLAEIMHESNTFNQIATTRQDFESRYYLTGPEIPKLLADTNTEIWGVLEAARQCGWRVTHPFAASASPSGPMAGKDWAEIKYQILAPLRSGERFDAVFLVLHGSMVTQTSDDAEGELLVEARQLAGPDIPIVATLDMHANVSQRMVENSTLLMAYRTYPHVDQFERAQHLMGLLQQILEHDLEVIQKFERRPMMDAANHGQTSSGPMPKLLALAGEMETHRDVLCASIQIGFPWSDVPDIGPSVLVAGLKTQADLCAGFAHDLMEAVWQSRHETQLEFTAPAKAMAAAKTQSLGSGPLILADFADNPAGGAYGDSANLLRHMIESGLENAAFATVCCPEAVKHAISVGPGAQIALKIGGRSSPDITPPLHADVEVLRLTDGRFTCEGPMWQGVNFSMGPVAVVRIQGVDVILSSLPVSVMDLQVFRSAGIEPAELTTIGLKSRNHFRAAYEPIAGKVMLVDAGGIASMRLDELPYRKIPRPIWPLDDIG